MDRAVDKTKIRQRFLIVCEGEKTEPRYFEKFRAPMLVVEVKGVGKNTHGVVGEAVAFREKAEYDQVWCVFDKDDFPVDDFENAIRRARRKGIKVAYSNQAFELWYVLHFEFLHSAIDRENYIKKMDGYLKSEYKKNDPEMYDKLRCKIEDAIKNSAKLLAEYDGKHPGRNDPSTTVHVLVTELLEQSKPLGK